MNKLKQKLENILKKETTFVDSESTEVNYNKVKDSADNIDEKLIELLVSDEEIRDKFFSKVKDIFVFNVQDFKFFLDESKVNNSYTKFKNKIGLSDGSELITTKDEVVLNFPFKDCVLEGGQSTEEGIDIYFEYNKKDNKYVQNESKRDEVFFNQVLAHDEIDRLLDKKALVNWKRFTKTTGDKGESVKKIERDENGLINENLVIKGNNLLALHSLESEYAERVKLIYIDPPYNTGGSLETFTYNNNFKHSTWLTFIKNRLEIAKKLLREDGFIAITIDHIELFYLGALADEIFGRDNRVGLVTVVHKPEGRQFANFFSPSNEFMLVYAKNKSLAEFESVILDEKLRERFKEEDESGTFRLKNFIRLTDGKYSLRVNKPDSYYPIYVSKDLQEFSITEKPGWLEALPVTDKGVERTWKTSKGTFMKKVALGDIVAKKENGKVVLYEKLRESQVFTTHWIKKDYHSYHFGTKLLEDILGRKDFSYPKSLHAVYDTLKLMTSDDDIILDFHAGSGTTAHATLMLNKIDSGSRRFILIEQLDRHIKICNERMQKVLKAEGLDDSFVYFELAKWNEKAKEEINDAKDLKALEKIFGSLYEKYFLNYNVKIKDFKEKLIKEEEFKKLSLEEQKRMFLTMLDLNQMYVQESEMKDKKFGISAEDQKMTKEFYKNS